MEKGDIFSVVFLCIINIIFMIAGLFLNSVVIISLRRSRQLRKKLCYFMILVLSCFDLAVVTVTHPLMISTTIYVSSEETSEARLDSRVTTSIGYVLYGSSMSALFMLNVERFLALTCPFFHKASVTKRRLICFQALFMNILIGLSTLVYFNPETIQSILAIVMVLSFLFFFICSNYKMFIIAKSKRVDERIPSTQAMSMNENRKKLISNFKNISTCSLAVGCFFFCSCPGNIYSVLRLTSETPFYDRQVFLFYMWSGTFHSMNSTFNCLIFFWRNSILRREGIKIVKVFRRSVVN